MQTCFFLLAAGDGVPEWVRIMPLGEFRPTEARDRRGPWRLTDAQAVIDASMADGRLAIDENHAIDIAAPKGGESPARGWIVAMEARSDGIYARVEWTPTGHTLMAEKAYRGFSPVFTSSKSGVVEQIYRVSITNNPALTELNLLSTRETPRMDLVLLRSALGLAETADADAILAAVRANAQTAAAHTQAMAAITTAAGLPAVTSTDVLVTALATQRATTGDLPQLRQEIVKLTTDLTTLRAEQSRRDAETFIDSAIAAGKPIVALRGHYIARHQVDRAAVETEIGAMVTLNAGAMPASGPAGGNSNGDLTQEDEQVIRLMGLKREDYMAHKKASAAKGAN